VIAFPSNVRVWIATGLTDMRRGMPGLALLVQEGFKRDPHAGDVFVFRGRRGDMVKIIWHDGFGLSLYAKRQISAMLSSPRRPSSTICILSSAEKCRRVARRISLATRSPGVSFEVKGFGLIFVPASLR
jgi:transposase